MSTLAAPIFEVAFNNGTWLSMPEGLSQKLYEKYEDGEDAVYCWDLQDSRSGSFEMDGEATSISRHQIHFGTWSQHNLDNRSRRSLRLVPTDKADPI